MPGKMTNEGWANRLGLDLSTEHQIGGEIPVDAVKGATEDVSFEDYDTATVQEYAKLDMNFLAGMCMPSVFEYAFPPVLLAAWALLADKIFLVKTFVYIALGIPRGHAKTTVLKIFVVFCVLFTNKHFILILGTTAAHAEAFLSDVMDMLTEHNVVRTFGDWRKAKVTERAELKRFFFGEKGKEREIIIAALGAGGSVRGLNLGNERPDLMIFDDIQSREDADSQYLSKKLKLWMYGTAMKAKSPKGCTFIFSANMYPTPYSLLRQFKDDPTWIKFISGAILADGTALWPEHRSYDSLVEEFETDMRAGMPEVFLAEVMNDTTNEFNTNINLNSILPWPYEGQIPQGKFIVIDPGTGKSHGDPTSIGYFEVFDGKPGMRRVVDGSWSPKQKIYMALIFAMQNNCRVIAVEATAYQSTLLFWFEEVCHDNQIEGFHFVPLYNTQKSKNARIMDAIKAVLANDIPVHPDALPAVSKQMIEFQPLKRNNNDGILDLLTFPNEIIELYGGLLITNEAIIIDNALNGQQRVTEGAWAF